MTISEVSAERRLWGLPMLPPRGGTPADGHADWIAKYFGRPELSPLEPEDVEALAAVVRAESFPARSTVFRIDEAPTRVGILRSGAVEFSRQVNGRRVVLQILRPGEGLIDLALFMRTSMPYQGIAVEDSVILMFDSIPFHHLLNDHPRLARRWLVSVTDRLVSYQARVFELLAGGMQAQVASVLLRRAERGVVKLSQSRLAELVGARRTSVNRVLKQLEEQNLVAARYGQVEILDEEGLAFVAGMG